MSCHTLCTVQEDLVYLVLTYEYLTILTQKPRTGTSASSTTTASRKRGRSRSVHIVLPITRGANVHYTTLSGHTRKSPTKEPELLHTLGMASGSDAPHPPPLHPRKYDRPPPISPLRLPSARTRQADTSSSHPSRKRRMCANTPQRPNPVPARPSPPTAPHRHPRPGSDGKKARISGTTWSRTSTVRTGHLRVDKYRRSVDAVRTHLAAPHPLVAILSCPAPRLHPVPSAVSCLSAPPMLGTPVRRLDEFSVGTAVGTSLMQCQHVDTAADLGFSQWLPHLTLPVVHARHGYGTQRTAASSI